MDVGVLSSLVMAVVSFAVVGIYQKFPVRTTQSRHAP